MEPNWSHQGPFSYIPLSFNHFVKSDHFPGDLARSKGRFYVEVCILSKNVKTFAVYFRQTAFSLLKIHESLCCVIHINSFILFCFFFFCCAFEVVGNAECGQNIHYRLDMIIVALSSKIYFLISGKGLSPKPVLQFWGSSATWRWHRRMCNILTKWLGSTVSIPFCLGSGWTFKDYWGPLTVFQRARLEAVDLTREIGSVHIAARGTEGPEQRESKRRRE